jgi:glutamate/tyrosine decarboxylase-like PLP-dependent enzyme
MTDSTATTDPQGLGRDWTAEEIKRIGYQVIDLIAEHLTHLSEQPVWQPYPLEQMDSLLHTPLPQTGQEVESLVHEVASQVLPYPLGNGHPRFFAWVNSPPTIVGVFAEALAAAMNPSCAGGNHAAIYVERQVLTWFKQLFGFPEEAMGLLVSGGSMATLTALAAARHARTSGDVRREGVQQTRAPLLIYRSEQGHSCIQKAAELLGIGSVHVRTIPVDTAYRMQVPALEETISSDVADGYRPMAVVASAGTTNMGAIDPLEDIAQVCRRNGLWLHIDGAYGAPALLTEQYRAALAPVALADSLAVDPHKWLSIPYEAGLVLVRDGQLLRETFSLVPEYLRTDGDVSGVNGPPWFSEYGFEQTRGFRALKVWMALKQHGVAGYTRAIDHDLHLAHYLASQISASPDLELVAPQSLSVVCFRYAPQLLRAQKERLNALNRQLVERVQRSGTAFLAGTTLGEHFVLRACIVNYHTTRSDIDQLVESVHEAGAAVVQVCNI